MDTKDNRQTKEPSIAFWGDSLTAGTPGASYFDILKQRLPEYKLLNYGKGGDTVINIYQRIKARQIDKPNDIALLWIGTNDVFVNLAWTYPPFKTLSKQPWTRSPEEFEEYYRSSLKLLCQQASKVISVPPLFMGENVNNRWHQELEGLSSVIERVSDSYEKVKFLNLRKIILPELNNKKPSEYLPTSLTTIALDSILLKESNEIDRKSTERGLFYTLDGVHLNRAGAELVSDIFLETIKSLE